MMKNLRERIPFALAAAVFLAILTTLAVKSLQANAGHLIYTLDDPYIHMATAKNLAAHGVFGVTRFSFSSSTSSPLWTLLLAASYGLWGVSDWIPGILATLFALAALYSADSLCRLLSVGAIGRSIICLAVVYFTPLVPVVSTGMEHAMHLFLAIVFIRTTIRFALDPGGRTLVYMCFGGLLAVAARYESLFLVAPLAFWLLCTKQWRGATMLVISSFLPVVAYGVFSAMNGSYLLPNSLMLKGHFANLDGIKAIINALGYRGFGILIGTSHLYVTCIILLLGSLLWRRESRLPIVALCIVSSIVLHLQFASTGWFFRYEAYLVAVSLPVIGGLYFGFRETLLPRFLDRTEARYWIALLGCTVLLVWPLHRRAKESLEQIVRASNHIYRQQYHMGQFIKQEYAPGVSVALNDLGAVSYFADAKIVDLWGLGTIEVARAKRRGDYNTATIHQLVTTRQVDVVMVYTNWFKGDHALPDDLIHVADWTTTSNYFGKTVSFLALSQEKSAELGERLRRYEANLPPSVEVEYEITEQSPAGDVLKAAPEE